jgi:ankyrin repeat protein
MSCSHADNCALHAQFAFNPAMKIWQQHYCDKDYKNCARYTLSLQGQSVPLNLLPNGVKVEAARTSDDYGATAIFNAILKRRTAMVESLLRSGTNVNTRDARGMTPLMAAATLGDEEIVRLLLAKGADPSLRNAAGQTASDVAYGAGHADLATQLDKAALRAADKAATDKRSGLFSRLLSNR